jgi:ribonuclease D
MDTEADSLYNYPQKVCLIQFSIPGEDALVDPLARLDLTPIWNALDDRVLLLHGADYDLRMLFRTYGFVPDRVFDTMLAARLLGLREFGLAALLDRYLGVHIDKASQKANWAQRPLTCRMLEYARADTHNLERLARTLRDQLTNLGRLDWHRQTCAQLIRDCTQPTSPNDPEPWRISGVNRLSRRAQAIARELWHWRESEAVDTNRPPFFVFPHHAILACAERAENGQSPTLGLPHRLSPHRRQGLEAAIERGLALPESAWPRPPRHHGTRLTSAQRSRFERLEQRRNQWAARLDLDPSLIASRSTLVLLAHDWNKHAPDILDWQRHLLDHPASEPH